MATSKDFMDYNRRYLELREIFEFLFPVKQVYKNEIPVHVVAEKRTLYDFHQLVAREIQICLGIYQDSDDREEVGFDLVQNNHIWGKRKNSRISINHNSYQIENELWYNIIFTLYYKNTAEEDDDFEYYSNTAEKNDSSKSIKIIKNFGLITQFIKNFGGGRNIYSFLGTMDKIAPFSTIGFWLCLRLRAYLCDQNRTQKCIDNDTLPQPFPILFHGSNPRLGGLQDILYQISCFIQEHKKVYINNVGPFELERIVYEDISLMQEKNNPYIVATCEYKSEMKKVKIYVKGDMDLQTYDSQWGKEKLKSIKTLETAEKDKNKEVTIHIYEKEFYYDLYLITNRKNITGDYLEKKVLSEGKWYDENAVRETNYGIITAKEKLNYSGFKYYSYGEKQWDIILFHFCIKEKDAESFERWVDSFGDFAYCKRNKEAGKDNVERGEILDNIYVEFRDNNSTRTRNKRNFKNAPLYTLLNKQTNYKNLNSHSVSFLELNWLMYTLCRYPNFSSVFLHTSIKNDSEAYGNLRTVRNIYNFVVQVHNEIITRYKESKEINPFFHSYGENKIPELNNRLCEEGKIENELKEVRKKIKGFLDEYSVEIDINAVRDLYQNHISRMYNAVTGIMKKNYYQCKNDGRIHNAVLPYAIDFDVITYDESGKGILVMAFDLIQKRVVAVPFNNFQFKKSENGIDGEIRYSYGKYDKLYYFCSCIVKLYLQNPKAANMILDILLKKELSNKILKLDDDDTDISSLPDDMKELYNNSIKQWDDYGRRSGASDRKKDLDCNGVALFTQKEFDHKKMVWKAMLYFYEQNLLDEICGEKYALLNDELCRELIIGNASKTIRKLLKRRLIKDIPGEIKDILKEGILNEIQYINSVLKIHELVFQLRDGCFQLDHIVIIYDYFRNFNCAGRFDGKNYIFKIQYEGFQYRKIHEILLSLHKWIEVLPEASFEQGDLSENEEQIKQSKLLTYRAGKEVLKEAIQEYLEKTKTSHDDEKEEDTGFEK